MVTMPGWFRALSRQILSHLIGEDTMFKAMLTGLMVAVMAICVQGQPLVDKVPGDAVVYVGWRGVDDPDVGFTETHFGALCEMMQVGETVEQLLDAIDRADPGDEQATLVTGLIRTIGRASWRLPTAVYVQPLPDEPGLPGEVVGRLVVLWQADGSQAEALLTSLKRIEAEATAEVPVRADRVEGGLVRLVVGPAEDPGAEMPTGKSLAETAAFQRRIGLVDADALFVCYLDGPGVLGQIDRQVSEESLETWRTVRAALGLDGFKGLAWSGGFEGQGWRMELFVDAPAPRRGVMTLLDGEPITEAELALVPGDATAFYATRMDLGRVLDEFRQVVVSIDEEAARRIEDGIRDGSEALGVDLEADLIRSMGSAWMVYTSPGGMGKGVMGMCLVNPLKDADRVERALGMLESIVNAKASEARAAGGGDMPFQFRIFTQERNGITLHMLGLGILTPTWAVHDGRLYVGLFPQAVQAAGAFSASGRPSILEEPKYQALRKKLGVGEANVIMYSDLPRTAGESYPGLVTLTQAVSGFLAMAGADEVTIPLPTFGELLALLSPSGHVGWSDESGYHLRASSPFPGSVMLGPQGVTTSAGAMSVGIMLPALGAARQSAREVKSLSQCRGIVLALVADATDNPDEVFTEDIAHLYENNLFDVEYALSPRSGLSVPADFDQWPMEQRKRWVRDNASYVVLPNLKAGFANGKIAIFERPDHAHSERIAVGFCDGHAEFMPVEQVREIVKAQTGMTLEELIDRQRHYREAVEPVENEAMEGVTP